MWTVLARGGATGLTGLGWLALLLYSASLIDTGRHVALGIGLFTGGALLTGLILLLLYHRRGWLAGAGLPLGAAGLVLLITLGPVYQAHAGRPVPARVTATRCRDTGYNTCGRQYRLAVVATGADLGWLDCPAGTVHRVGQPLAALVDPRGWFGPRIADCAGPGWLDTAGVAGGLVVTAGVLVAALVDTGRRPLRRRRTRA